MNNSRNLELSAFIDLTVETPTGGTKDNIKNNELSEISSGDLFNTSDNNVATRIRKKKKKKSVKRKCTITKNDGDHGSETLVVSRHIKKHKTDKFVINISTNINRNKKQSVEVGSSRHRICGQKRRKYIKNRISRSLSLSISSKNMHCDCCKCVNKRGKLKLSKIGNEIRSTKERRHHKRSNQTHTNASSGSKYVINPHAVSKKKKKKSPIDIHRSGYKKKDTKLVRTNESTCRTILRGDKIKPSSIIWEKMERPTPQCLRFQCQHTMERNVRNHICGENTNSPGLKGISSDDLDISDCEGSYFRFSDIDPLIARTKKRDQTMLEKEYKRLFVEVNKLHTWKENDNQIDCDTAIFSPSDSVNTIKLLSEESGSETPVLVIPCENEKINSNMCEEKYVNGINKKGGTLKLVPLQRLLRPEVLKFNKVSSDMDLNGNHDNVISQSNNSATNCSQIKLEIGQVLQERYEISEILKNGQFSNLIRAYDKQNCKQTVVLKILHNNVPSHVIDILTTLRLADSLGKSHCVRLIGSVALSGHSCLLLENYHSNLRTCLNYREKGCDIDTVQQLSRQMLLAVRRLKKCHIIHTDIKPEHILINSREDNIKLTGFDRAITMKAKEHRKLHPTSNIQLTLGYMAPEYLMDMTIGYSVDVWSAACVAYEMATGNKLFDANTVEEVLWQIINLKGALPKSLTKSKTGKKIFAATGQMFYQNENYGVAEIKPPTRNLKMELEGESMRGEILHTEQETRGRKQKHGQLAAALQAMLILDSKRRISVKFALLNQFFQNNPSNN